MAGLIQPSVSGQADLKALAARLKEASATGLTKELRKAMRTAAKPALRDVQEAVRTLEVHGVGGGGTAGRAAYHATRFKRSPKAGHGLRSTIARATRAEVKTSGDVRMTIRTFGRYLPPDQRRLPRYLDRAKGWRHPLFGNREYWVRQVGGPWFGSTLKRQAPQVRREVLAAMQRTAEQITNG